MLLAFLALTALTQTPARITYLEPAAPLSRLIPSLAKALNEPLDVSRILKSDVACIDVHDVTPQELLDRLAWATGGQWDLRKDGTQVLVVSDKLRQKQANEELKHRAAMITRYLTPNADAEALHLWPISLDIKPILRLIDPMILAAIPDDGRIVFSTRPNRLQVPFPTDVSEAVQKVVSRFAARIESENANGNNNPSRFGPPATPIVGTIDKVVLPVSPIWLEGTECLGGDVQLYDSAGKNLCGDQSGMTYLTSFPALTPDHSKPIEFSKESLLFARFISNEMDGRSTMQMLRTSRAPDKLVPISESQRAEILRRFLDPEQFDPLGYASDILRTLAHARREQLVACLPDSVVTEIPDAMHGKPTEQALETKLSNTRDLDLHNDGGWLTARPRDPFRAEAERVDRRELARMLNLVETRPYITFADEQQIAKFGFGLNRDQLVTFWLTLARPSFFADEPHPDWEMLRLYCSLTDEERARLDNNQRVVIGTSTDDQSGPLGRMLYGEDWWTRLQGKPRNEVEPTEIKLAGRATLRIESSETPTVLGPRTANPTARRALGADPIGEGRLITEAARIAATSGADGQSGLDSHFYRSLPKMLKTGKRRNITLRIEFGQGLELVGSFNDDTISDNEVSYADLRARNKSDYDAAFLNWTQLIKELNEARKAAAHP